MRFQICRVSLVSAALAALVSASAEAQEEPIPGFNSEVRPILARCLPCHGPDPNARKAGLELHHAAGATAPRTRGPAIIPGNATASSLFQRILSQDPNRRMPPPGHGQALDEEEIDLIKRWIDAGAQYETHWAWTAPQATIPRSGEGWAIRDLDQFVAEKHKAHGIEPAPEADRYTLARRVKLDLLGLPPTPEEVDLFVTDSRADAYEHYVQKLLESPAFGERWARIWMDVARYADTKGYEQDGNRTIWPWRDWVIQAFNSDKPFNEFTIEQLAGDLLPDAQEDQILATAFHRNTMTNDEGGTRDEEFRMAAVIDRVNTTMEAWMGLSASCAQCHDHKFDPISQQEYYQLIAIFNTTQDADRNDEAPILAVLDADVRLRLKALKLDQTQLSETLDMQGEEILSQETPELTKGRGFLPLVEDVVPPGATARGNSEPAPFPWRSSQSEPSPASGVRMRESTAEPNQFVQHFFDDAAPGAAIELQEGDLLVAWVWIDPENPPTEIMLQWHAPRGGWDHRAVWGTHAIGLGVDGTSSKRKIGELPEAGRWARLETDPALLDLHPGDLLNGVAFSQQGGHVYWDAAGVDTDTPHRNQWKTNPDAWIAAMEKVAGRGLPEHLKAAVNAGTNRTIEDERALKRYWATRITPEGISRFEETLTRLNLIESEIAAIPNAAPRVPVMREQTSEQARTTHLLRRGDWRSPEGQVSPGTPAFLPPLANQSPVDRLAFAQWLVSPENPLTARVQVNRAWERFFGRGLVQTQEDFGTQGEPPSNQALLDHLAKRFVELEWSWKALCREIVTSATYRQSSSLRDDLLALDPENILLARGPRFRLEAEAIRDSALFAGGRLNSTLYGPPVFPSQPDGVWQITYNNSTWKVAEDDNRYRRALYTFWRRTAPYPAMLTFDAGSRETCMSRRIRTNTPLQALTTLNDEPFIEAAGGLALRAYQEADGNTQDELVRAFRLALARPPKPEELSILESLLAKEIARYSARPEAASTLINTSRIEIPPGLDPEELAARIVVANVILNLDEFLVRG